MGKSPPMLPRWLGPNHVLALVWLTVPAVVGPLVDGPLADQPTTAGRAVAAALWAAWGGALFAMLVPRTTTLSVVRIGVPAAAVPVVVGALHESAEPSSVALGTTVVGVATIAALSRQVGDRFVDGSSYGPERRWALRPPAALLLGPIPLAWLVIVAGTASGPLLLLAEQWVAAVIALAVGVPVAAGAARALHALSRRWLVSVPGGVVIHDHLTLSDPVLVPKGALHEVAPARVEDDSDRSADLTAAATGPVVALRLSRPIDLLAAPRRGAPPPELTQAALLLVSPTRTEPFIRHHRT